MAFNGTGTFLRLYTWATDKINSIPITASRVDAEMDGMATGLSNCITKDGQTTISANIPFNSFKATGLGVGTARTDAITVGQVQDNQFLYLGTTSGSADAYTLAPSPAITAYTATQQFTAKISATNLTTTPYLQVSAIANPATTAVIKKLSATKTEIAVGIGDLVANGIYTFQRNSANDAWIVLELSNRKIPTIQKFTSGSGTCTISEGTLYLGVKMVGGGGGGSGSHLNATSGGTGGNTTFGSSLLVANGGGAGNYSSNASAGGTVSLGSAIGTALSGGTGTGGASQGTVQVMGGAGASSPLGGGGGGGALNLAGQAAATNTGAGGGGGGSGSTANGFSGTGGSAGGFVDAIISSPSATYSYAVGAAGAAGAAGTGGYAGGTGGTGYIEITEFYN